MNFQKLHLLLFLNSILSDTVDLKIYIYADVIIINSFHMGVFDKSLKLTCEWI